MFKTISSKARFYYRLFYIFGTIMAISFFMMLYAIYKCDLGGMMYGFAIAFTSAMIEWFFLCKASRTVDQIIINLGDDSEEY